MGSTKGGTIVPGLCDFTSDVELAVKSLIGAAYLERDFNSFTDPEKERIGKEFMRRKIFPLHVYMKPKSINDIRKI